MKRIRLILDGPLATREEINEETTGDGGTRVTVTSQTKPLAAVWSELEKFNPRLEFAPAMQFGRWVAKIDNGNKTAVAVELPPGVRDFQYRNSSPGSSYKDTPGKIFKVAFPYIYLVVVLEGNRLCRVLVYYRNSAAVTSADELSQSNLPNIRREGDGSYWGDQLCTGDWGIDVTLSLPQKINAVVREFLSAEYNADLRGNRCSPALGFKANGEPTGNAQSVPGHPRSFEEWQERSAADPGFVLQLPWVKAGVTLEAILRKGVA